jgi:phosphatidylinositol glycan class F
MSAGTVVAALVALAFGAPTSFEFAARTWHWACLMSSLTVLPAAIVLGASWTDWQRVFAFTKPHGGVELAVCIPAHGAALGAWVGAWPMPLDWERPWQEWPVCCTYGAGGGYLLGLVVTVILCFVNVRNVRPKQD